MTDAADYIFLVVNAAAEEAPGRYSANCRRLTEARITYGADIVSETRFKAAQRIGCMEPRIVMYQCGSEGDRDRGTHCFRAAGRLVEVQGRGQEELAVELPELYRLTRFCYPSKAFVGVVRYSFPRGLLERPLDGRWVKPVEIRGRNFVRKGRSGAMYALLNDWWNVNCDRL